MRIIIHIFIFVYIFICPDLVLADRIKVADKSTSVSVPDNFLFTDCIYKESIHTVQLYRSGWPLSFPHRNLRDTIRLVLEFDDLADQPGRYTYTLIHCTSAWEPTDLPESAYLAGLSESEIMDYRYSRNTLQPYIHYSLKLPNENMDFKLPGNYLLYVYEDFDREQPVLTRRLYIIDPLVEIRADIHRTDNLHFLDSKQEVDFTVGFQRITATDPAREFSVSILQNYDWNTAITDLEPKYIHPGTLVYDYEEENLFPGGSEYRHLDTKSLRFNSDRIAAIRFERPIRHVYLKPDLIRDLKTYEYQQDLNGMYLVKWDDATDSGTEADYVMVHFTLQTGLDFGDQEVHLFGGLTDRVLGLHSRMDYDPESRSYRKDLLLKQGYYNYTYILTDAGQAPLFPNPVEGSFFATVNDYCIFVYYRDIRERFDRLVGLQIENSLKSSGK